jgi:hypothetical protein
LATLISSAAGARAADAGVGLGEVALHAGHPAAVAPGPRGEPASDVAAAGDGGEIVELVEHVRAGQPLDDAQGEGGAADAAAGDAERGARTRIDFAIRGEMEGVVNVLEPHVAQWLDGAGKRIIDNPPVQYLELPLLGDRIVHEVVLLEERAARAGDGRRLQELRRRPGLHERVQLVEKDVFRKLVECEIARSEDRARPADVGDLGSFVLRVDGRQRTVHRHVFLFEHFMHFARQRHGIPRDEPFNG